MNLEQKTDEIEQCRHAFSETEQRWIYSACDEQRPERFIQMWTLKESYLKMLGTGFLVDPTEVPIEVKNGVYCAPNVGVCLTSIKLDNDYYVSLSTTERETTIEEVHLSELISFMDSNFILD